MDRTQNLRPFKPGQSGNPAGRPKTAIDFSRRARERLSDPAEFEKLWRRAQKSDYIMRTIMEYAFGKPQQGITVSGEVNHRYVVDVFASPDIAAAVADTTEQPDASVRH